MNRCFFPWFFYMISTVYYFSIVLDDDYDDSEFYEDILYKWLLGIIILTLVSYQIFIEVLQIIGGGFKQYFRSPYNWADIFQLASTTIIVIESLFSFQETDKSRIRIFAAFSIFVVWLKVFDWLRLFEGTTFYIKLVNQTFSDLTHFMILFVAVLCMFGSSMYILQLSRHPTHYEIVSEIWGHFILDLIHNQYMLGLGEF